MTIPSQTFVLRQDPLFTRSVPIFPVAIMNGKQGRFIHDAKRKRNIYFGGDQQSTLYNATAPGLMISYDPVLDVLGADASQGFRYMSGQCMGPGTVVPARPDDGQPCGVDYRDDVFVTTPGAWKMTQGQIDSGAFCGSPAVGGPMGTWPPAPYGSQGIPNIDGGEYYLGLMKLDLSSSTGHWTAVSQSAVVIGNTNGWFDPVSRCLISISPNASIDKLNVDSATLTSSTALDATALGLIFNANAGGYLYPSGTAVCAEQWAMDPIGRWGYAMALCYHYAPGAIFEYVDPIFFRFNLDNPAIQQLLALPPYRQATGYTAPNNEALFLSWDTRNRCVVWFYTRTTTGYVHGVQVYHPTSNTWEQVPIVKYASQPYSEISDVCCICVGYDSTNNVHIGCNSIAGFDPMGVEPPAPSCGSYFLWRYN